MKEKSCCIKTCDMFDFMSEHVGLTVLHPGGWKTTKILLESLKIERGQRILDIACGKGMTSLYMAQRYGCHVKGVDISETAIEYAQQAAKHKGLDHLVTFQVADALDLPFGPNEFDYTLAQAMLILVKDKLQVLQEAIRVLKPTGRSGWVELSWKTAPPPAFLVQATQAICAACIANVETFDKWETLLYEGGLKKVEVQKYSMEYQGLKGIIANEGVKNALKIMLKYIGSKPIRTRMKKLNTFFQSYPEYIGYGIYIGSK